MNVTSNDGNAHDVRLYSDITAGELRAHVVVVKPHVHDLQSGHLVISALSSIGMPLIRMV